MFQILEKLEISSHIKIIFLNAKPILWLIEVLFVIFQFSYKCLKTLFIIYFIIFDKLKHDQFFHFIIN